MLLDVGHQKSASRWRSTLSVRHSFASSTTLRGRLPLCCSSLASKRAKRENASAVEPAKPATIFVFVESAKLFRGRFENFLAHRDLAVAGHHDLAVAADTKDCRGTNSGHLAPSL